MNVAQDTAFLTDMGERIRQRRNALGWSQQQLGDLVGVTYVKISLIESGKNAPRPRLLKRIALALGVPVDGILPDDA